MSERPLANRRRKFDAQEDSCGCTLLQSAGLAVLLGIPIIVWFILEIYPDSYIVKPINSEYYLCCS